MMRSRTPRSSNISPGDFVHFWRDDFRWIGPAKVTKIMGTVVTLVHNERTKTSDLSRIRKTAPSLELFDEFGEPSQIDAEVAIPPENNLDGNPTPNSVPNRNGTNDQNEQSDEEQYADANGNLPWISGTHPPTQTAPPRSPIRTRSRSQADASSGYT